MNVNKMICPHCGAEMVQEGSSNGVVRYHCEFCGYNASSELKTEDNAEYWQARGELLERVRVGVLNWKTTRWDYLCNDITAFMGTHEAASVDARMKMALIASLTSGFQHMDKETYKRCKLIFKITERVYKVHLKEMEAIMREFPKEEDMRAYEEYRDMYKHCRNEYRNTKLLWKGVFFVMRKLTVFIPT